MMRTKMFMTALVVGALIQTTVAPPLVEANLWAERRAQSVRQRSLPERAGRLTLAALPTPDRIRLASPDLADFRSANNPLGIPIPLECGSVRKITSPHASPSSRVVIHIQDVHHNEAAQRKIGSAIESLVANGSVGFVALEGASGPIEINGLRRLSRPDILRTVADYLLWVHDISGPVHSAITGNQVFPPIVGVDDAAHYRANVAAYQRAEPRQRATQEVLKRVQVDLDRRCEEGLNQPLLKFVKLAQSFHNEITPLGSYIRALLSDGPKKAAGSSLVWFQEALDLEGRLDFKQVEREREDLLRVLLRRLNVGDIEKLAQKSTAYRLGKIRYSEFYGDLRALCAQNGVDLHRFPQMEMYIRYVLMADKIDPETLFTDLRALEGAILAQRIKSPSEKRLVEEATVLGFAKKLAAFLLTTEEWKQYTSLSKDFLVREGLNLQDFEAFYREAQARDTAMADNVLREMKNNPSKPAVLVTGGFHSSGLTDQLTRAGVTVVRFTPRIEKIDTAQGSGYLSVFSQEKTPLESLFQGQKLFLATSPANVGKFSFLAAITGAAKEKDPSARKRIFAHLYSEAAGLLGFDNTKQVIPKIKVRDSADGKISFAVQWKGTTYVVSFTDEKIVDFHPLPREDSMWGRVIAFLKRLAGKITRRIPLKVVADHENGLPRVDLLEAGTPGFAKDTLLTAFRATRDKLIKQGRADGKPYFPYLYESRDREVVIEADGIKTVLVDVAERAGYDKPRRLSEFARHPRDIREGHPDDKCVFCRLMGANSDEFFARVQGTGRNVYHATVNLGEYGYPHFQFISENPVPNLYDRDNRFMDYLLSARALGPELGVMINGPFSGASQRHLHWHAIKIKAGGLWAYLDSLSPPDRKGSTVRVVLSNYPGHPILFRGTSLEELNTEITKELDALYDQQISAGVHGRVKMDGSFEIVVAPTRGEAMVSFDIVLNASDEEFEKHREAVRNYNLFGIMDPSFDPIAEGMGAMHTPGNYPNILMELTDEFRMNRELQRRTAGRLLKLFGDYNPTLFHPTFDRPLRAVGFFPSLASRKFYVGVPALYRQGNANVDRLYREAAEVLNMYGPDGQLDPTQLSMQNLPAGEGKPGAIFRDFVLFNLALEIKFQSEARKRKIPYKIEAYAGISAGLITAAVASGSLSIKDVAKLADYFWTNILQEARNAGEQVQYYTVNDINPESYARQIESSHLNGIVDIYHYVSPSSVQVFVPVGQIPAFLEFNEKISGVRLEPIRTPTYEYSHSPKLVLARQRLEKFLDEKKIVFQNPKIPILSNNGGTLLTTASEVRTAILAIVNEPMKTEQTVQWLSSLNPDFLIEFGLGGRGKLILDLNKSEVPFQSWGVNRQGREAVFSQVSKLLKERDSSSQPTVLAQTLFTKSVWKGVAGMFKISPNYKYSKHLEFAFTALWEFFLHWVAPFFIVSWLFASIGLPLPDMWLFPVLAVILEPVFVGSHPFSAQGKDLTRLAHFLMSFYGAGGFLIAWGGWGPALGVLFIISGLFLHFFHDFSRAPPSSLDEGNVESKNANEMADKSETALRAVISLPGPVDAQLRNATARFAFVAALDEAAVRDRSVVKSKHTLLSLLDAYAKAGEGWKGNLSQVVNEENAGVWVVPVGSDWKSMGALARACLSSRGRHTEIRFIAENEAVALALRFWSLGRGRVQVRTVPKAFSPGSGNHRIVRLFTVQQSLARDVVLRSGTAWRIVAPDSIAMDYSGLAENSPLWNAPVVFLDAILRALPVPARSLRNLDGSAVRLMKRMA